MKPLRDASDQLQAYTEFGNDYRPLPVQQMDEIGILITGFNQLLSQLSAKEQIASHEAYRYSALLEFSIEAIVVHRAGKITSSIRQPSLYLVQSGQKS